MPLISPAPSRLRYWQCRLRLLLWLVTARHARALAVLGTMLRLRPDDMYSLASRSHLLAQLGRPDDAIADALAVTRTHTPCAAVHWFNLGYLMERAGDLGAAEHAFRRSAALDPKLDRTWYGLGLVLIRLHRFDAAIEALKRNVDLQPLSPYGWYQLARVHGLRNEFDEVRRIIQHLKGFERKVAAQLERETGSA
jgi:tetratricopeptide (TPR) repeat protein